MWSIKRLFLKNFAPILAGTGKETIDLDLSGVMNRIIIFIGPIGSGKTYILSHLQPFATVGSLDVRNGGDPIVEGKDGLKIIEYEKDGHEYIITHTYTWSGKSHAKHHSIEKDGVELNPNGNRSSFLDIIQLEFGIDQSFLRLVRIGANVSNFIIMKATERKSFVANLLKDTEMYLYLYKCWSGDLREMNTKVNILMNKITTFSKIPLEELKANMQDLEDIRKDAMDKVDHLKEKKANHKAEANSILGNKTIQEFLESLSNNKKEIEIINTQIKLLEEDLASYGSMLSEKEINQLIGKSEAELAQYTEGVQITSDKYEDCISRYNKTFDKKKMLGDESHIETLRLQYNDMLKRMNEIENLIKDFKCKYSASQLESLLEELNSMSIIVGQICQYDDKSISFVYGSDSSIIEYSNKKVEILNARKIKVQKMMSNLQFSEEYEASQIMFRPPFCPTDTCPYYKTHPVTIKKIEGGKTNFEPQLLRYQEELKSLDVDIYHYQDYPVIYSRIGAVREYWKSLSPILKDIGALKITELKKVILLSNYNVFYDYDKIIDTIDLVKQRDAYYELTESIKAVKNELSQFDINQSEDLNKLLEELSKEKDELAKQLEEKEKGRRDSKANLESLNELYLKLSKKTQVESELSIMKDRKKVISEEIANMEINYSKLSDITKLISEIDKDLLIAMDRLSDITRKIDDLRTKINDISYTSKELEELLNEQRWMTAMVDAVSSKKGIPMKMVELFFDSCRGTVNDMLSMVSGDEFEILDFKITDKEFTIPYICNGVVVEDIASASQGQTSLSSLALSFALVKELTSRSSSATADYNIPLLDEPDSALHKSDKPKLLSIIMKYLDDIQSRQCFIISHSEDTYYGNDVQLIITSSDEVINKDKYPNAIFI